jgi:hypothetical protein
MSFLFLSACGQSMKQFNPDPHPNIGIGPEFAPFVAQFEADYGASIGNFPITFSAQTGNTIGVCKIWSDGYRIIEIDPTFWNNLNISDARRKSLIYHELGHCILNRGHDNAYISSPTYGSIPKSIMNMYLMEELSYANLQPYYIGELFHPGTSQVSAPMTQNDCIHYVGNNSESNIQHND